MRTSNGAWDTNDMPAETERQFRTIVGRGLGSGHRLTGWGALGSSLADVKLTQVPLWGWSDRMR